jgi:catechol-2,3-dioxygenase
LQHFAFQVDSFEALKDAYFTLQDHGIEGIRAIDHISQKSIYFPDPDGHTVEIYHELPNALAMFREGREDRDEPIIFER